MVLCDGTNRRQVLKSVAVSLAAVGMGQAGLSGDSTTNVKPAVTPTQVDKKSLKLSRAVMEGAHRQCATAARRALNGSPSSGDFRAAGASLEILHAHFEEVGVTDLLQQELPRWRETHPDNFLSDEDINRIHRDIANAGIPMTRDAVVKALVPANPDMAARVVESFDRDGVREVLRGFEKMMDRVAHILEQREKKGPLLVAYARQSDAEKARCDYLNDCAMAAGLTAAVLGLAAIAFPALALAAAEAALVAAAAVAAAWWFGCYKDLDDPAIA